MPKNDQPGPHPAIAQAATEQAERERTAGKAEPPAPHPMQAMAAALGTDTHTLSREAMDEYRAGHPKKAARAQQEAVAEITESAESKE